MSCCLKRNNPLFRTVKFLIQPTPAQLPLIVTLHSAQTKATTAVSGTALLCNVMLAIHVLF